MLQSNVLTLHTVLLLGENTMEVPHPITTELMYNNRS